MGLPFPASNGSPTPASISSVTRIRGSFTTTRSPTSIAKIELLILSADEPKPGRPLPGTVTPGVPANSSHSEAKSSAADRSSAIYFSNLDSRRSANFLPPV
jgi:hypothetical protein